MLVSHKARRRLRAGVGYWDTSDLDREPPTNALAATIDDRPRNTLNQINPPCTHIGMPQMDPMASDRSALFELPMLRTPRLASEEVQE